jgi:hypothetical protein
MSQELIPEDKESPEPERGKVYKYSVIEDYIKNGSALTRNETIKTVVLAVVGAIAVGYMAWEMIYHQSMYSLTMPTFDKVPVVEAQLYTGSDTTIDNTVE